MAALRTMILVDPDLEPDAAARPDAIASVGAGRPPAIPVSRSLRLPAARALSRFLREGKAAVGLHGEVTVLLTTDEALRNLNRRFRGKNKPTDVLSFPAEPHGPRAERVTGDLAISVPTARLQAAQQGHSLSTEIKVLILHGLLHLAGYDHESDNGQMERRERRLRAGLGLPGGLIERTSAKSPFRDGIQRSHGRPKRGRA